MYNRNNHLVPPPALHHERVDARDFGEQWNQSIGEPDRLSLSLSLRQAGFSPSTNRPIACNSVSHALVPSGKERNENHPPPANWFRELGLYWAEASLLWKWNKPPILFDPCGRRQISH